MDAITLQTRQLVNWPPAPAGVAQVDELLRTRVRLFYRTKTGRDRRPLVSAVRLTPSTDYLVDNVFGPSSAEAQQRISGRPHMLTRLQLQTVQIARRDVAKLSNGHFTEEMFRSLLRLQGGVKADETGHVSSKNLTNAGFDKVMAWMEENGFRDRLPGRGETYWRDRCGYRTGYCTPRQVFEIHRIAPMQPYDLRAMCLKFSNGHSDAPEKLTINQAQKLIEMLKDAAARCAEKMPAGVEEGGASTGDTAGKHSDHTPQPASGNEILPW